MKKSFSLILVLLYLQLSFAQNFLYQASLPLQDSTGFYKIELIPSVNTKLKDDFADLRIIDNEGKETPYILKHDYRISTVSNFKEYPIIDKKIIKDSITQIIFRNNTRERISMFSFVIRNAEVIKQMKLSGSDDMKQWFVVKEWESCGPFRNNKNDSIISLYPIPVSDYEYFKIEIDDKHSDPVNIIKIGYYEDATNYSGLTEIKSALQITDSAKKKTTWAHIIFNENV